MPANIETDICQRLLNRGSMGYFRLDIPTFTAENTSSPQ